MAKLRQVIESAMQVEKLRRELLATQVLAVLLQKRTDEDKKYEVHYQAIAEELNGKNPEQLLQVLTRLAQEGSTYYPWAVKSGNTIAKNKLALPGVIITTLRELVLD